MKIVATTSANGSARLRVFLVEMSATEFEAVAGVHPEHQGVGTHADVVKAWRELRNMQERAAEAKRAAEGFRALAEMTDMLSAQFAKVVGTEAGKEAS